MLTKLVVRNFKRFKYEEIELGNPVVFIGPNDSGKTSALQAIALWEIGVKRWMEKRKGSKTPESRPGVSINRKDLVSIPSRNAKHLWRNLTVRNVEKKPSGQITNNIRIDIIVKGFLENEWTCGMEFDYANEESFYCRPLRKNDDTSLRMPVPEEAAKVNIAYLPPMSGLASSEIKLDPGAINVKIGEGRTAEILRNLCYQITSSENKIRQNWVGFCKKINDLFGIILARIIHKK